MIWMPHSGANATPISARKLPNLAKNSSGMNMPTSATGAMVTISSVVHERSLQRREIAQPDRRGVDAGRGRAEIRGRDEVRAR